MTEPNVSGYLKTLQDLPPTGKSLPLLGVDENLNHDKIVMLTRSLVSRGKVAQSTPLWYKSRVSALTGELLFCIAGGVDKDTNLEPFYTDLGKDKQGETWSDNRVAAALVVNFSSSDHLVLLTADTHRNKDGLWAILNQEAKPNLPPRRSINVLYKVGKDMDVYCQKVQEFFDRQATFKPGYYECPLPC
jgi:hypothetical protein